MNQIRNIKEKIDNLQASLCAKCYEQRTFPIAKDGVYTSVRINGKYLEYSINELYFTGKDWVEHEEVQTTFRALDKLLGLKKIDKSLEDYKKLYNFICYLSDVVDDIKPYLFGNKHAFQYAIEECIGELPWSAHRDLDLHMIREIFPTKFRRRNYTVTVNFDGSVGQFDDFWLQYSELVRAVSLLTLMHYAVSCSKPLTTLYCEEVRLFQRSLQKLQSTVDTFTARVNKFYGV